MELISHTRSGRLASVMEPGFTHPSFEGREALRIFRLRVPEPVGRHLRVVS